MASETQKNDQSAPEAAAGVRRRGLLRFGTLLTAFTGASAISALGASSAHAGPGDKNPPTSYVPIAEKGVASGVATLDLESKIPPAQLPDLSATYATPGDVTAATAPASARNPVYHQYNVKAFGAKGDGTTNDTGSINAAKDAAGAAAVLYFPPGTYIVDGLNANIAGQTWNLHREATLKLKNSASTLYALKVLAIAGFTLNGGTLDGNGTNQAGGNMFQITGSSDVKIRDVTVKNARTYGLAIQGSARVSVRDCTFLNCLSGVGQANYHATYGMATDIDFSGNLVDMRDVPIGNANTGGFTSYGSSANHNQRVNISNNRIFVNKDTVPTSTGCVGILYTDYATVNGNVCFGSGIAISIAGGSKFVTVNGNTAQGFFDYGLEFSGTSDCSASGNIIDATGGRFAISITAWAARTSINGGIYTSGSSQCINLATSTSTTFNSLTLNLAGSSSGLIANNAGRFTVTGSTFLGNGVADSAIKTINSAGEIVITGNKFRDMVTTGVRIDATAATTTDNVAITGGNMTVNTPSVYAVMGLATLGAKSITTGNV